MKRTPLKRGKPLERGEKPLQRRSELSRGTSGLKRSKGLRARSFSQRYDGTGERYGQAFVEVRAMPCWLEQEGYDGLGHEGCGPGVQGGHTAHHIGKFDSEGLIPGCGAAHDLYAGLGGRTTAEAFKAWLETMGYELQTVGLTFFELVAAPSTCECGFGFVRHKETEAHVMYLCTGPSEHQWFVEKERG